MRRIKPLETVLVVALLPCGPLALAQGQVVFNNSSQTLISTNGWHLGPALGPTAPNSATGGPQFVYALFAAPSTVTSISGVMDPNWTFTGAYGTNTTLAGRLIGGDPVLPAPYATGTTWNFLVRGWSAEIAGLDWPSVQAFMHTFEADPNTGGALGQLFGTSVIATIVAGGGANPLPNIFGTIPGRSVQGFLLDQVPVPEPSALALLGLGGSVGAGCAVARRRRSARQRVRLFGDPSRET